jgi:hypothetical protein
MSNGQAFHSKLRQVEICADTGARQGLGELVSSEITQGASPPVHF